MMKIQTNGQEVSISLGETVILRHSPSSPLLEIGKADFHYVSTRGGLQRIHIPLRELIALQGCEVKETGLRLFAGNTSVEITLTPSDHGFGLSFALPDGYNCSCLGIVAEKAEAVYGGGVQFNHLNLRGRKFPIWTSEMGLGRHPLRPYTWLANWVADAGGEYWNTYFPQPAYISTRGYGCIAETDEYSEMDFSRPSSHQLFTLNRGQFRFFVGRDLSELVGTQAMILGKMPEPPGWVFEGGILGIQGGLPYVRETVERVRAAGAKLTGIWTQDWTGVRMLWQGKRLFWNWVYDQALYPDLPAEIRRYRELGIRWLAYLNPYFNVEGEYFKIAHAENYLVKDRRGETLIHSIAGFHVGCIDLTNPQAWQWFKESIIQKNILELGIRGWMADYGEDIPEQARFADGRTGSELHNLYPKLWAELNREAIEEAGLQDDVLIFHRSGYSGATKYMNMNWGGDQVVYWNQHDGLPSGVAGGLSGCMSGVQYYHTDAGGYFSFKWIKRSKEMLMRWCEANAFSPVLRTHEGNRPWAGAQPWQDAETLSHFSFMSQIHAALAPYLRHVSSEAQQCGIGMMRPFCLANPEQKWQDKKDAYYLGVDLLVYPVLMPHANRLRVEIPEGDWVGLFTGKEYGKGVYWVDCPLGRPAVFYRKGSEFTSLFQQIPR